jgi:hypothetical protein
MRNDYLHPLNYNIWQMNRTSKNPNFQPAKTMLTIGKYMAGLIVCFFFMDGLAQDADREKPAGKKPFRVLVFLGTDCPISQDYIGVLNKISSQFGGVSGAVPENISNKQIKSFQIDYQVAFPLELDKDHELVKKYSITVTPEVVLLDTFGNVLYRGAIDNWYYELGKHRQTVTEHYLIDAIQASIAGETIKIKEAKPVGCILSMHH